MQIILQKKSPEGSQLAQINKSESHVKEREQATAPMADELAQDIQQQIQSAQALKTVEPPEP